MVIRFSFIFLFFLFLYPTIYCQIQDQLSTYNFSSSESGNTDLLFSNEQIQIWDIHISATKNSASFDYILSEDIKDVVPTIVFYNILGSQIKKYQLPSNEIKITFSLDNFPEGIYFYTLSIGHNNLITKKFILKR